MATAVGTSTGSSATSAREAKRAGGVYYTPAPIVDYIVRQTLGPLLVGQQPRQVAKLRVLDPACGAGAFLLGAYRYLLAWHRDWYLQHGAERHPRKIALNEQGQWLPTTQLKASILRNNLFGVDIDAAALASARAELAQANLHWGDALVGSDFQASANQPCAAELAPVRPLDWQAAFPEVLRAGGFDAVIGNPPYVNIRVLTKRQGPAIKDYFRQHYACAAGAYDLYTLFIERAQQLLRPHGRCGLIVPNKLATLDYAAPCRRLLQEQTTLEQIADVSDRRWFPTASVYPYILVWQKSPPPQKHEIAILRAAPAAELAIAPQRSVRQAGLDAAGGFALHGGVELETRVATAPLGERARLHSGTTGFVAQQVAAALQERTAAREQAFDFIVSGNIDRYCVRPGKVRFMRRQFAAPCLAIDHELLTENKRRMFAGPKLVIAGMTRRLEAAFDAGGLALGVQVYAAAEMKDDPHFLLGLLNSKLLSHVYNTRFQAKHLAGGFLAINKGQLAQLPIRLVNDEPSRAQRDEIIALVQQILACQALVGAASELAKRSLSRQIEALDRQIDQLVYRLYGLRPQELALVESAAGIARAA